LFVVLYGCETWSLTLREKRRLWVFENRVLRRIFGPKRDEVTRECRKLHNGELNDLYCSPNTYCYGGKIEKNEMGGACSANGGEERHIQGFWWGNLGDQGVDGRILKWILRKWDVGLWTGSSWLRIGTGGGHL